MKISNKLLIFTLSIVIICVIVTSSIFYFITKANTDQQIQMHLESVSVLKENQLNNYFQHSIDEIEHIDSEILGEYYNAYINHLPTIDSARLNVLKEYNIHNATSNFFELFLMDTGGKVIFSTDKHQEKKIKKDSLYFEKGKNDTYIQNFYYSLTLSQPAITIARPIFDSNRTLIGVVAARLNTIKISEIMTENAGLGISGETYLINKFNYAVTDLKKFDNSIFKKLINTYAVDACLENKNQDVELGIYKDYADEIVIGAYSWLPESEVCLFVEIDESEAHISLNERLKVMIVVFIVLLLFSTGVVVFFSDQISRPLNKLKTGAQKIAEGDLNYNLKINTRDEIKEVANSFNHMIKELKKSRKEVEEHEEILEDSVKKRTKELNKKLEEIENTKLAVMNILEDTDESNKQLLELRDQLNHNIRKLKEMDKTKDEFLSITAHELKTPITSIRGFLELLQNEKVINNKEMRDKYFKIIVDDTRRLAQLVTDILDLSRLDIGTMKLYFEKVSIKEIFEELKNLVDLAIKNKGVKPIYKIGKNVPALYVDKSRILQVISNLVNNSIKYTEKGYIKIKAELKGKYVHFIVEDTGKGIPKKEHNKIFKRFYQVDSSYTRKVGGTGLGLAICRGIVEEHGGKIWVEKSVIDKGTTVEFTIPVKNKKSNKQKKSKKSKK